MSDESKTSIRATIKDICLSPENREYGDEEKVLYALLNGEAPNPKVVGFSMPRGSFRVQVNFPSGTDFVEMSNFVDHLRVAVNAECRAWAVVQGL